MSSHHASTAAAADLDEAEKQLLVHGEAAADSERQSDTPDDVRVEWHLRTGWVISFAICCTVLVFIALQTFTNMFIVEDATPLPELDRAAPAFQRASSDYIVDPHWNYHAAPTTRTYRWNLTDTVINPDGVFRSMITINGQFPGPLIECNEGDTLVIELENHLVNATALHFHGLFQNGTNGMDGTTGVTQCPIAPGHTFRYEFTIREQWGTYYYHSHSAAQIADGFFGPVVVHTPNEKKYQRLEYTTDRVVLIHDYYHDLSSGLLRDTLSPGSEGSPIPDGALINGMNQVNCTFHTNRACNSTMAAVAAFGLLRNQHHRLRLINIGAFAWFDVSVDGHQLAVTEVDGTDVEPAPTRRVYLSPAQRYSVILTTNQTAHDAFYLRARMITHCFTDPFQPPHGAAEVRAIIQYRDRKHPTTAVQLPATQPWEDPVAVLCRDPPPDTYQPIPAMPAPAKADRSYYTRSNLQIGNWRLERGFFNDSSFRPDLRSPLLHRLIDGLHEQNETFTTSVAHDGVNREAFDAKSEMIVQHSSIQVVDLIIQNFDEGNHPMHLHGHKFWVLGQGHGMFSVSGFDVDDIDLSNPLRRDTASVEGFGWLVIRFVTDNPGIWAFHCHMVWHSEAGLAMMFLSQPDQVAQWSISEESRKLCAAPGLEKGAVPSDDIWFGFGVGRP